MNAIIGYTTLANREGVTYEEKSGFIDNNVSDAFADPESYEKILAAADQGIAGVNSAVRKYKNARDAFEKLFIERAKSYGDCKRKIESKSQELTKTYRFTEQIAAKFGLT